MLIICKIRKYLSGDSLNGVLLNKSGSSFIIKVTGTACAFLLQVVLARFLGAAGFGEYIYVITWINFFILLGILGFDSASLKFLPAYSASQDSARTLGFITRSLQFVVTVSLLVAIAGAAFVYLSNTIPAGLTLLFMLGFLLVPVNASARLLGSYLQAALRFRAALIPQHVVRPLLMISTITIVFYGINIEATAQAALLANIICGLIIIAILAILVHPYVRSHGKGTRKYETAQWRDTAFPLLLISALNIVLTQADIVMVGGFIGTTEAGIYAVAVKTATLIAFILTSVNSAAAPMISRLYTEQKLAELQRLITFSAKIVFFVSLPLFVIIFAFNDIILSVFGTEFTGGSQSLMILAGAQLFNALTGSVGFLLSMTGHHNYALRILAATACINITLNFILIPILGITGAAIATAASTAFWNLAMFVTCRQLLGLNSTIVNFSFGGAGK